MYCIVLCCIVLYCVFLFFLILCWIQASNWDVWLWPKTDRISTICSSSIPKSSLVNSHTYATSPCLMGNSTINGHFKIAMLSYQGVDGWLNTQTWSSKRARKCNPATEIVTESSAWGAPSHVFGKFWDIIPRSPCRKGFCRKNHYGNPSNCW